MCTLDGLDQPIPNIIWQASLHHAFIYRKRDDGLDSDLMKVMIVKYSLLLCTPLGVCKFRSNCPFILYVCEHNKELLTYMKFWGFLKFLFFFSHACFTKNAVHQNGAIP